LDALQNSHKKFENGQSRTFEPHLVYNQRWTFHVAFLFVIEDLVPTTTMQQTQDRLKLCFQVPTKYHLVFVVAISPSTIAKQTSCRIARSTKNVVAKKGCLG
jgi:hypothetical protein